MKIEEYKNIAVQRLNKTILNNPKESISYSCMGLIEETGEIIAELRKPLFKGNFHEKTLDLEEIKSELGDLIWYIALICKDCDIDMNQLQEYKTKEVNIQSSKRERLICIAINMGQMTGQIVECCVNSYTKNEDSEELIKKISEQYNNISQLANLLGVTIDEILNLNLRKINSRYNEKGEVIRENEKEL